MLSLYKQPKKVAGRWRRIASDRRRSLLRRAGRKVHLINVWWLFTGHERRVGVLAGEHRARESSDPSCSPAVVDAAQHAGLRVRRRRAAGGSGGGGPAQAGYVQ